MKDNKVYTFELYRFIFIILIAIMHFKEDCLMAGYAAENVGGGVKYLTGAYLGVDFFFILAGFFVYVSYSKQIYKSDVSGTIKYIIHKFTRLYPEYIIALIGMIITKILVSKNLIYILKNAIFTRKYQYIMLSAINIPETSGEMRSIWYLTPMLIMSYIIFFLLSKYKDFYIGFIATIVNLFVIVYLMNKKGSLSLHTTVITGIFTGGMFRAFVDMNLGVLTAIVAIKMREYNFTKVAKIVATIIEVIAIYVTIKQILSQPDLADYNILIAFPILIIFGWNEMSYITKHLNIKFFAKLGNYSYSIYLTHLIISTVIVRFLIHEEWWIIFSLYIIFTLLISIINKFLSEILVHILSKIKWINDKYE